DESCAAVAGVTCGEGIVTGASPGVDVAGAAGGAAGVATFGVDAGPGWAAGALAGAVSPAASTADAGGVAVSSRAGDAAGGVPASRSSSGRRSRLAVPRPDGTSDASPDGDVTVAGSRAAG